MSYIQNIKLSLRHYLCTVSQAHNGKGTVKTNESERFSKEQKNTVNYQIDLNVSNKIFSIILGGDSDTSGSSTTAPNLSAI